MVLVSDSCVAYPHMVSEYPDVGQPLYMVNCPVSALPQNPETPIVDVVVDVDVVEVLVVVEVEVVEVVVDVEVVEVVVEVVVVLVEVVVDVDVVEVDVVVDVEVVVEVEVVEVDVEVVRVALATAILRFIRFAAWLYQNMTMSRQGPFANACPIHLSKYVKV